MRLLESFTWVHVFIVSLAVTGLVAAAVHVALPGTYTASSSLLLEDPPEPLATVAGDADATGPSLERMKAILVSRALRERVSDSLSLPETLEVSRAEALDALSEMTSLRDIGQDGVTVTISIGGFFEPRVALRGNPLSFEAARTLCAEIANAYPAELAEYLRELDLERARESHRILSERHDGLRTELDDTRDGLQRLRAQYELLDPDSRAARLGERIRVLEEEYAQVTAETDATSSALREAEKQLSTIDATRIASAVETRNPLITSLEQELVGLSTELASELAAGKTTEHRDVAQIQSAIDNIREELAQLQELVLRDVGEQPNPLYDDTIRRVVDLRVQLSGARARRAETRALLSEARARMSEMPAVAREYVEFGAREQVASERLSAVERALWLADFQETRAEVSPHFRVLDTAVPSDDRRGPPTILAALITFAAMMVLQGVLIIDRRWFAG